jgi:MSHA biogenesis protein MshP
MNSRGQKIEANFMIRLTGEALSGIELKKQIGSGTSKRQSGFSLVAAIFLLVVIAALGTFAVTLSTTQQQSAALDVLGSRAYQASRAGIEWGTYQVLKNSACPASPAVLAALPNTLANFTVTVQCSSTAASEAGTAITIYQLISTATQGTPATPNYVERQMSVTIAQ